MLNDTKVSGFWWVSKDVTENMMSKKIGTIDPTEKQEDDRVQQLHFVDTKKKQIVLHALKILAQKLKKGRVTLKKTKKKLEKRNSVEETIGANPRAAKLATEQIKKVNHPDAPNTLKQAKAAKQSNTPKQPKESKAHKTKQAKLELLDKASAKAAKISRRLEAKNNARRSKNSGQDDSEAVDIDFDICAELIRKKLKELPKDKEDKARRFTYALMGQKEGEAKLLGISKHDLVKQFIVHAVNWKPTKISKNTIISRNGANNKQGMTQENVVPHNEQRVAQEAHAREKQGITQDAGDNLNHRHANSSDASSANKTSPSLKPYSYSHGDYDYMGYRDLDDDSYPEEPPEPKIIYNHDLSNITHQERQIKFILIPMIKQIMTQ